MWRERDGQLRVEQLQALPLGREAEDLVLESLVLLLQGVKRLEHLHDCGEEGERHTHTRQLSGVKTACVCGGKWWDVMQEGSVGWIVKASLF